MKKGTIIFLVLFCFAPVLCGAEDLSSIFQDANTCYRTGDYEKAAALYETLTQKEPDIAVFYYDLANASFRIGKLSKAILNYEKFLVLAPRNADARKNLLHIRGLVEYRVEDTRNWYLKAGETILKYATEREIQVAALAILCVFLLGGVLFFLNGRGIFWSFWQKSVLVLLFLSVVVAFGKHVQTTMIREAIVMQKECEARYGPSEHDQIAFKMGEGIKVFVMDHREDWSRILLTNGESGWVKDSDIAEVKI